MAGMGLIQYSVRAECGPGHFFRRCGRFQIEIVVLVVVGVVDAVVVVGIVIEAAVAGCTMRRLFVVDVVVVAEVIGVAVWW
jgi:hypothetical protein